MSIEIPMSGLESWAEQQTRFGYHIRELLSLKPNLHIHTQNARFLT